MLEPEPIWQPELHLDRVYRRGRRLRRRRRVAVIAGPAAIAVVGAFAVGGATSQTARPVRVAQSGPLHQSTSGGDASGGDAGAAASGGAGGEVGGAVAGGNGVTSVGGTPAESPAAGSGTPLSPGGPARTTADGGLGQPTNQPAPGGSAARPNTAAPTSATDGSCPSSALDYSTVTDRSSYASGQPVSISLVIHNHSNRPCDGPGPCGVGPWATVQSSSGATVWQSHPIAIACSNPPPAPPHLGPGQSVTYSAGTWNQTVCTASGSCSSRAQPGTYRAVAHRGDVRAAGTRFTIS